MLSGRPAFPGNSIAQVLSAILRYRLDRALEILRAESIPPPEAMHYNRGRPHAALGPGLPLPMSERGSLHENRHSLPVGYRVVRRSILGGLHHEYGLVKEARSDGRICFCAPQGTMTDSPRS
jgi:hypothetical protein